MDTTQDYLETKEKFAAVVAKSLHLPVEKVTDDAYLNDLGAESLDLIEITMETEEACNVCISEKSILQTAIEVFGPNVLEVDGVLTTEGKALLRARLPELNPEALNGEITIKALNKEFLNVGNWVRMIMHLAEHTPKICGACGGPLGPAVALRMKCLNCGVESVVPSGEELNRKWVQDYYALNYVPAGESTETAVAEA
jgi:acyl carrier protein